MSNLKNNTTQLEALLAKVNALPETGGITLPALDNEGVAADLREGKELIDSQGNIVTGTMADLTNFDTITVRSETDGYVNGIHVYPNVDTLVPIDSTSSVAYPVAYSFNFYNLSITFTVEHTGECHSLSTPTHHFNIGGMHDLAFNPGDVIIVTGTSDL